MTYYIELSGKRGKGHRTLIDEETYNKYNHLSWYLSDTGYAMRKNKGEALRLHRLVINAPEDKVVDHLNNNKLDNRLSNLRICTQKENANNRSGTKGYSWDKSKGKWVVRYRNKFFGRYDTEEKASRAYQLACSGVEYNKKQRMRYMLPEGVFFYKGYKKPYVARPQINGKRNFLGYFATAEEAKNAYDNFRQKEKQDISGTKAGGAKAAAKNLANDPLFYKKIGSKGGKHIGPKGFALNNERARSAGALGGSRSKRGLKLVNGEYIKK